MLPFFASTAPYLGRGARVQVRAAARRRVSLAARHSLRTTDSTARCRSLEGATEHSASENLSRSPHTLRTTDSTARCLVARSSIGRCESAAALDGRVALRLSTACYVRWRHRRRRSRNCARTRAQTLAQLHSPFRVQSESHHVISDRRRNPSTGEGIAQQRVDMGHPARP